MNNKFVCVNLNVINLLLSLNGLALIIMGLLVLLVYMRDYFYVSGFIYTLTAAYILFGTVLIILAVTGSVSVFSRNFVLLGFYIFSLIVLLGIIIIATVVTVTFDQRGLFYSRIDRGLNDSILVSIFIRILLKNIEYSK